MWSECEDEYECDDEHESESGCKGNRHAKVLASIPR